MLQMLPQLPYAPSRKASLPLNLRGFDVLVKRQHTMPIHVILSVLLKGTLPAQCYWCI